MGFKARKTYKSKGWLPVEENTVDKMVYAAELDLTRLLYLDTDPTPHDTKVRRVESTVTIEVKEISR